MMEPAELASDSDSETGPLLGDVIDDAESLDGETSLTPATVEDTESIQGTECETVSTSAAQATKAIEAALGRGPDRHDLGEENEVQNRPSPPYPGRSHNDYDYNTMRDAGPAPPDYAAATSSGRRDISYTPGASPVPNEPVIGTQPSDISWLVNSIRKHQWWLTVSFGWVLGLILAHYFLKPSTDLPTRKEIPEVHLRPERRARMDPRCELDSQMKVEIPFENPTSFSLVEQVGPVTCGPRFTQCSLIGDVHVYNFEPDQCHLIGERFGGVPMVVKVSAATAWPWKITNINYRKEGDSLILEPPELDKRIFDPSDADKMDKPVEWSSHGPRCLDYMITISICDTAKLVNWITKMRHFDFFEGALYRETMGELTMDMLINAVDSTSEKPGDRQFRAFRVTNTTTIKSDHGKVHARYWNSHKTVIESRTGNVTGAYIFDESLSISTYSGHIRVGVDPRHPRFSRNLSTDFDQLITQSRTGNTTVDVWSRPRNFTGQVERQGYFPYHYKAKHSTSSGSIALRLPAEFEGHINGFSVFGNAKLSGNDLYEVATPDGESAQLCSAVGSDSATQHAKAGRVQFDSDTGDVDIAVGLGKAWKLDHPGL